MAPQNDHLTTEFKHLSQIGPSGIPLPRANWEEQVTIIDDLEPVPDFIRHPYVRACFEPRRVFRFLSTSRSNSSAFMTMLSLTAGLVLLFTSLYQVGPIEELSLRLKAKPLSWQFLLVISAISYPVWLLDNFLSYYLAGALGSPRGSQRIRFANSLSYLSFLPSLLIAALVMQLVPAWTNQSYVFATCLAIGMQSLYGACFISEASNLSYFQGLNIRMVSSLVLGLIGFGILESLLFWLPG